MLNLRNILKWPRRYRTSRGFGVHSPFAFDFITKVLRDFDACYYAYPEIDALCGKTHRDTLLDNMVFSLGDYERQEARMMFRILCHLNPDQIIEIGGASEVSRLIIERAHPTAALFRWSRDNPTPIDPAKTALIIVNYTIDVNFSTVRSYLLKAVSMPKGVTIIFRNLHIPVVRRLWREIEMTLSFGMTFHDDITAIYVADSRLPRQDFDMLL